MNNLHWMPFFVAEYAAITAHLTAAEYGAFVLLLGHFWMHGELPKEDEKLARIARMSAREWKAAKPTLQTLFEADWRPARLAQELEKVSIISERRSANARKRWAKSDGFADANAYANAHANASPNTDFASSDAMPRARVIQPHIQRSSNDERNAREARANSFDQEFQNEFWAKWPNKVGREAALKAFVRARRNGAQLADILAGVERYKRSKPADREWMNPETFLRDKRWQDAPPNGAAQTSPATSTQIKIKRDSEQGRAWEAHMGKIIPWKSDGVWWFDSEWPPGHAPPQPIAGPS